MLKGNYKHVSSPKLLQVLVRLISIACDMSDLPATLQMTRALRTQPSIYKMTLDKDNYNDPLHVS